MCHGNDSAFQVSVGKQQTFILCIYSITNQKTAFNDDDDNNNNNNRNDNNPVCLEF